MNGEDDVTTVEHDNIVTSVDLLFLFVSFVMVLMMQAGFAMHEVRCISI